MGTDPTPPGQPAPLMLPADEFAVVSLAWRAWVDGPTREAFDRAVREIADDAAGPWRARTEAAEAKLAAIAEICREECSVVNEGPRLVAIVRALDILTIIGTEKDVRGGAYDMWGADFGVEGGKA